MRDIRLYLIRVILTLLAISWMLLIYGFSNQDGDDSSSLSGEVSYQIVKTTAELRNENLSEVELWIRAYRIEYPVRKLAHMSEYAIMAGLWYLTLLSYGMKGKKRLCIPILVVFGYACTDEIHQLFVAERSGKFTDVLFDTSGAIFMMLVILICERIVERCREIKAG